MFPIRLLKTMKLTRTGKCLCKVHQVAYWGTRKIFHPTFFLFRSFLQQLSKQSPKSNDVLVTNFINPLSGLANLSFENVLFFKKDSIRLTKTSFLYQAGERVLTGIKTGPVADPSTGKPINFLNSFALLGLYFQTGAWERNNAKNVGVAWTAFRYIGCYTNPQQLKEILPSIQTNGIYLGWSIAWGC